MAIYNVMPSVHRKLVSSFLAQVESGPRSMSGSLPCLAFGLCTIHCIEADRKTKPIAQVLPKRNIRMPRRLGL